jgi:hypothetical protein
MALKLTTSYLEDSIELFRYYKKLAEAAIAQVDDQQLFLTLDEEMNSIAIIIKHMTGNMRSRWTDFLTSDGEKPDRHRDTEFEEPRLATGFNEGLGGRLESSFRRTGTTHRFGPGPHGHHPW